MRARLLLLLLLAATGPAAAAEPVVPVSPRPPDTPPERTDPARVPLKGVRWIGTPSPDRWTDGPYPRRRSPGLNGAFAILGCTINPGGALRDCTVVQEVPAGVGAGAEALRQSRRFRAAPYTTYGRPTAGGYVEVTIRWR